MTADSKLSNNHTFWVAQWKSGGGVLLYRLTAFTGFCGFLRPLQADVIAVLLLSSMLFNSFFNHLV